MNLVIVESPNKKSTIQKYLGNDFKVEASVGHIIDLASTGKYNLGVNIESGNFEPEWEIMANKISVKEKLIKLAKSCDEVYFASDPDREGEAIAYHLAELLGINPSSAKRLEFHEITRHAILDSLNNVRPINMNLYHAQETRRIMDRIIGYRLSFIYKRDINCPSAGRVQSVVLKFIYENKKNIDEFKKETFYNVKGKLNGYDIELINCSKDSEKIDYKNEEDANKVKENTGDLLTLVSKSTEHKKVSSFPPYTMSKIIQAASKIYHYSTSVTTNALKILFESGYITYPRTDSVRLAPEFINKVKGFIKDNFGEDYVGVAKVQSKKDGVADAHEALRPTDLSVSSNDIKEALKSRASVSVINIYNLIFKQTVQSIMKAKEEDHETYLFESNGNYYTFNNIKITFDGFDRFDKEKIVNVDYPFKENQQVDIKELYVDSFDTKPEAYYTEGSLVKKMEETGIGRPSTYASTIKTLLDNGYISIVDNHIEISSSGVKATEYSIKNFPETIKTEYTADLENKLDLVEKGQASEVEILRKCNDDFLKEFDIKVKNPDEKESNETGEICPVCGSPLIKISFKNNEFIGCSNYPKCNFRKSIEIGRNCPKCGKPLVQKSGPYGKFIACSGYPNCIYREYPKNNFKKKFAKKTK